MSKSYEPLNPKATDKKPAWLSEEGVMPLMSLITDDTEFGAGYALEVPAVTDDKGAITEPAHWKYATRKLFKDKEKWEEVTIKAGRVLRYTGAKSLPF